MGSGFAGAVVACTVGRIDDVAFAGLGVVLDDALQAAQLGAVVQRDEGHALRGAAEFADRLLTLPLHADVRQRDVELMCDILHQVGV